MCCCLFFQKIVRRFFVIVLLCLTDVDTKRLVLSLSCSFHQVTATAVNIVVFSHCVLCHVFVVIMWWWRIFSECYIVLFFFRKWTFFVFPLCLMSCFHYLLYYFLMMTTNSIQSHQNEKSLCVFNDYLDHFTLDTKKIWSYK